MKSYVVVASLFSAKTSHVQASIVALLPVDAQGLASVIELPQQQQKKKCWAAISSQLKKQTGH